MPATALMILASLLFAAMGVCVKLASAQYGAGELVFYRSAIGAAAIFGVARWRGVALSTPVPAMHFWRSASGVLALLLWFYGLAGLPLATAMTLNYMSSVWMALFLIGGAVLAGSARVDGRLVAAALAGFCGVALVLRPTIDPQQLWFGLAGLLSGVLSALAYLQVTALGRAGEPAPRIVFYFSLGGMVLGATWMALHGASTHTPRGVALLVSIGVLATVAQTAMTRAYRIGSTLANACLQYLGIVFSVALGATIFGDALGTAALAGMALIIAAGIAATLLRERAQGLPNRNPEHDT